MKAIAILCVAALLLLAAAMPPPYALGDRRITDPNVLADLQDRHVRMLTRMKESEKSYIHIDELTDHLNNPLRKRGPEAIIPTFLGLALDVFAEVGGELGAYAAEIAADIQRAFSKEDHAVWTDPGHCRVYFQTHAGSELNFQTWNISSEEPDTNWNDK